MRKISLKMNILLVFATAGTMIYVHSSNASETSAKTAIEEGHKAFADALNLKDPKKLVDFLHTHIAPEAKFNVKVSSDDAKTAPSEVTMGKADYINSYLYGTRQVKNYHMDIKTGAVKTTEGGKLEVQETYIETGLMTNPADPSKPGQDFISRTSCVTSYSAGENEKGLRVDGATCKTDISFLQEA